MGKLECKRFLMNNFAIETDAILAGYISVYAVCGSPSEDGNAH